MTMTVTDFNVHISFRKYLIRQLLRPVLPGGLEGRKKKGDARRSNEPGKTLL